MDHAIWRMSCHISIGLVRFEHFQSVKKFNLIFVEISDTIVAYDRRSYRGLDVLDRYPEHYSGTIISRDMLLKGLPDEKHIEMINIIVGGWNNYVRNQDRLTGLLSFKMEQSKLIGFKPIMVMSHLKLISWHFADYDLSPKREFRF